MKANLDFLVIGAQKAGTTSLWHYLREHPLLRFPRDKELSVFAFMTPSEADFATGIPSLFEDVQPNSLLGTVSPNYMIGNLSGEPGEDVPVVAGRIAAALPDVKLIAVLRDPIERAVSAYRMAFRRGQERRPVDGALEELLEPDRLERSRSCPTDPSSLVVAGEYGRVLRAYREHFPADRLLVLYSDDLDRDPGRVLDRILVFLGIEPGFRPEGLGLRHFRGGRRKLLDPESQKLLFRFYDEQILPYLRGDPEMHRRAFRFFFQTWNVRPDDQRPVLSGEVRRRLEDHYRSDAQKLFEQGIDAPWVRGWDG